MPQKSTFFYPKVLDRPRHPHPRPASAQVADGERDATPTVKRPALRQQSRRGALRTPCLRMAESCRQNGGDRMPHSFLGTCHRSASARTRSNHVREEWLRHVRQPQPTARRKRPSSSATSCRSCPSATRCSSPARWRRSTSAARSRSRSSRTSTTSPRPVIAIFAQRDPSTDDPGKEDLHHVGCAARVLKALKHSSGNYSLILQGLTRIRLDEVTADAPVPEGQDRAASTSRTSSDDEAEALSMSLRDIAKQVIQLMPELPREAGSLIDSIQAPGALADLVAANLDAPVEEKAQLLETIDVKERIRKVLRLLTRQLEILKMRERINSQIKEEMGKNQREYVLRQQLKAIKEELGEDEGDQGDLDGLEERIAKANLPHRGRAGREEAAQAPAQHAGRLAPSTRSCAPTSTGSSTCRGTCRRRTTWTSRAVRKVLDEDHYGLEKVKKRILEYLAVRKLKKDKKGPILCLIGPPGVGKTSLGRSIARALGRKFVRISLGGVHDEAAIRGHRRTYVGALPGQIIQGMKKAGTINPVFMMDEVDKIGHDFRGDPVGGAPRGARPGAEQHLRRPLPRDPVRPLERHVRRHGQRRRPHPAAAPRPHGDPRDPRLHAAREARHRAPAPHPQAARGARPHQGAARHHRPGASTIDHRPLHARGRRPHARAADRRASSAASP